MRPLMEDLVGTADERMQKLVELDAAGVLSAEWLRDQLTLALLAWADDETRLRVDAEGREDF
jgi:hypothetical protein